MENVSDSYSQLCIKQEEPSLVPPAEATYKGPYFLSNLDQAPLVVRTIYGFKSDAKGDEDAQKVLKTALSKVLVHYYPLAGRLTLNSDGKLLVDCTGEGAVFVAAEANYTIERIGDIRKSDPATLRKLVYDFPRRETSFHGPRTDILWSIYPLVIQVTKFKCGGFVVGATVSHCLADGCSAMDFMNSFGETARGFPITVPPFLDRSIFKARTPPKLEPQDLQDFGEIEDISEIGKVYEEEMLYSSFYFDPEKLEQLKKNALEDGVLDNCTTFQALTAFIWRARTRALRMRPEQQARIVIAVDGRSRFEPPLPKGFFGNAGIMTSTTCRARELLENPVSFAVGLVQKTIRKATENYARTNIDYWEIKRGWPSFTAALVVTSWSRLSFHSVDFGWGEPIFYEPVDYPMREGIILLSQHWNGTKGIYTRLGLPASAMKIYDELVMRI